MSLSVDYIYNWSLKLILKNQSNSLTPKQFELHWNDAQGSYQDDLLGRFQLRNNGKTGINTGLIEDETILQKLSPFTQPISILIQSGKVTKPADFIYRLAFRINGYDCYKINQNQKATVNQSVIDPPSIDNNQFYFIEYKNYYSLLPISLPTASIIKAELDYISTPPNIVWGYKFDTQKREVYDPATSVQSLWDDNSNREITKRMLKTLGVSFKDRDFAMFGQRVQTTGE